MHLWYLGEHIYDKFDECYTEMNALTIYHKGKKPFKQIFLTIPSATFVENYDVLHTRESSCVKTQETYHPCHILSFVACMSCWGIPCPGPGGGGGKAGYPGPGPGQGVSNLFYSWLGGGVRAGMGVPCPGHCQGGDGVGAGWTDKQSESITCPGHWYFVRKW